MSLLIPADSSRRTSNRAADHQTLILVLGCRWYRNVGQRHNPSDGKHTVCPAPPSSVNPTGQATVALRMWLNRSFDVAHRILPPQCQKLTRQHPWNMEALQSRRLAGSAPICKYPFLQGICRCRQQQRCPPAAKAQDVLSVSPPRNPGVHHHVCVEVARHQAHPVNQTSSSPFKRSLALLSAGTVLYAANHGCRFVQSCEGKTTWPLT
ncbi:hypothetical protein QBC41DRAFT_19928 [Cercophora samala]|uniref:Uncharacterized protein n=1 Tax=Cercophora samala TaxID=330535 RepID=A0AA39ZK79_9PEZI|nr:hypothetical protein QBC41DRAFT_19928 [Cercophora samala]